MKRLGGLSAFLSFLLMIPALISPVPCSALDGVFLPEAEKTAQQIIEYSGAGDAQDFADVIMSERIGGDAEWYAFSLRRFDRSVDLTAYKNSVGRYVLQKNIPSATTRLKFALALLMCGDRENGFIEKTLDDAVGKQGIMSLVFGLHVLNAAEGINSERGAKVAADILSLCKEDGGWAVTGSFSDVDVTAMTLQALAPHAGKDAGIKAAAERAIALLSEKQLENGGYSSYGAENAESCSQVIIALTAYGIDPAKDQRFIKNGNSALDALLGYKNADGSFSHVVSGETNRLATAQAFCALTSYISFCGGEGRLFDPLPDNPVDPDDPDKPADPDDPDDPDDHPATGTHTGSETAPPVTGKPQTDAPGTDPEEAKGPDRNETTSPDAGNGGDREKKSVSYKSVAVISVTAATALVFIVFIIKKKSYKSYLFTGIISCALIAAILLVNISSPDEYYGSVSEKTDVAGKVTLKISCLPVLGMDGEGRLPENGLVLDTSEFEIEEGETVYDLLIEAAKKYTILVDAKGGAGMAYVSGIASIYEYEFGDLSGWVYFVNGEMPSVGCSSYTLSDGDSVIWAYSSDLGNDVDPEKI